MLDYLCVAGLVGNPLNPDMLKLYSEGTQKLLTYLLDSLVGEYNCEYRTSSF